MTKPRIEYRSVYQSKGNKGSKIFTFPKDMAKDMNLEKGDYVKMTLDKANKRIIIEKADV